MFGSVFWFLEITEWRFVSFRLYNILKYLKDICSVWYLDGISVRCFLKYLEQNISTCINFSEGTLNAFNDVEDSWWLNGKRRVLYCLLWMAKFLMAFGRKAFCPANVSWWSFPFCFCLPFDETSMFWHSISFRMWVSTGFGSGRAYIKTPTHMHLQFINEAETFHVIRFLYEFAIQMELPNK